jgi:hypothetical protein
MLFIPRLTKIELFLEASLMGHATWNSLPRISIFSYFLSSSAEVKERVELYLHSPNTSLWRDSKVQLRSIQYDSLDFFPRPA